MRAFNRGLCHAFIFGMALLFSAAGWGAPVSGDLQLTLHTDAVVTGKHIAMADLLTVASRNNELKTMVESMHVGNAPRVGYVERYTREDLEQLIRSRLVPYSGVVEWSGANAIKVRVAGQLLSGDAFSKEVKEAVKKELDGRFSDVALNVSSQLADIELPVGDLSWKLRRIDMDHLFSRLPVWVDISVNKEAYRAVVVSFSLKLSAAVQVARRDLQVGTVLSAEDFESKIEDVSEISQDVAQAVDIETPVRMKKVLKKGQILMRDQLSPTGMVFRGDSVKLMLSEGGLMIETRAVAEQDGNLGQFVKVRPDASVATVTALIVAPGVVKVGGM